MPVAEPSVCVQPIDCLLDKWDAAYRNLELAETKLATSKDKKRPTHRLGCCGCRGIHLQSSTTPDRVCWLCRGAHDTASSIMIGKFDRCLHSLPGAYALTHWLHRRRSRRLQAAPK